MSIAQNIKTLRQSAGITQKKLSIATGIPLQSIINYENGRREPNSKAMAALERYFNVSGDALRGNAPIYAIDDTAENIDFYNQAFTLAMNDFNKKCGSACRGRSEAYDTMMMAYIVVNGFLDAPQNAAENIKNFNELLNNYHLLTDSGRLEMLRRMIEHRELEEFKAK